MGIKYTYQDNTDFDYLISQLDNPTTLLRGFASYRKSQFNQQMAKGTDPYGASYAPLSAAYQTAKARAGYGGRPILSRSGEMRSSYDAQVSGRRIVESINGAAQYHQQGTSKMPQRLVLPDGRGLPPKDQEKLIQLAIEFIERSVRSK